MRMLSFAQYDGSGRILRSGRCPARDMALQGERVLWVATPVDDRAYMVANGQLVERPAMALTQDRAVAALGQPVVFGGIPAGTVVRFAGQSLTVDDGELSWSSASPGHYRFRFECWPYRDQVRTLEVVE